METSIGPIRDVFDFDNSDTDTTAKTQAHEKCSMSALFAFVGIIFGLKYRLSIECMYYEQRQISQWLKRRIVSSSLFVLLT